MDADRGHIKSMFLYEKLLTIDKIIHKNLKEAFMYT